jgi:hypothetical protein
MVLRLRKQSAKDMLDRLNQQQEAIRSHLTQHPEDKGRESPAWSAILARKRAIRAWEVGETG